MTGPKPDPRDIETRPISVAELLAKNGTIGSPPVTGRRRRRRNNADAVTVAELTGEIPIIRDDENPPEQSAPAESPEPESSERSDREPSGGLLTGPAPGFVDEDRPAAGPRPLERETRPDTGPRPVERVEFIQRSVPEPRWPKSPPQPPRGNGPQQSPYPRPMRRSDPPVAENGRPAETRPTGSGAERMRPDPVDTYTDIEVDVMDTEVRDPDLPVGDSAYVRSFLSKVGGPERSVRSDFDADTADRGEAGFTGPEEADAAETEQAEEYVGRPGVVGGALVVLQSMLAVAFGGGLFIVFDQLWRWNSIVALVLTVLVTLGLVAAVQAVRKTVDIVSTLIAVAVGLLVTLGPLALHAN
ncbi:hypothetical protein MTER_35550 [Mycolicibacter terrae]|uniref:Transmembrane protein n=1 Tax=Mycolicibacter terrae TaxID=1788 RepID=A0AAD1HZB4_9MYCO|nr:hypothetical protein [Mycolicibacter terrae]ORW93721.1 hypothetical protein AWC28_16800 [Mycolicibacter terrae]BBX24144.1 hypothetical protein MTER_35550 [Mycolicibacter terrae]SNV56015.1 transmembrane protein [Mycolicibacter terrae]